MFPFLHIILFVFFIFCRDQKHGYRTHKFFGDQFKLFGVRLNTSCKLVASAAKDTPIHAKQIYLEEYDGLNRFCLYTPTIYLCIKVYKCDIHNFILL